MKSLVLLCAAAVIPLTMTAACGQKGPLYLPPRNGTVVTRPAGSNTTPTTDQPSSTPQPAGSVPPDKKNIDESSQPPK